MTTAFTYVGSELDLFAPATELEVVLPRPARPLPRRGRPGGRRRARRDDPRPLPGDRAAMGRPGARRRRWPAGSLDEVRSGSLPACCEVRVGTLEGADPAGDLRHDPLHGRPRAHRGRPGRGRPGRAAPPPRRPRHRPLAGPPVALHPVRPRRSATTGATPGPASGPWPRPTWSRSGSATSTRSASSPRSATGSCSRARCRSPRRSPSGTASWSGCRGSSTRSSATRRASRSWRSGGRVAGPPGAHRLSGRPGPTPSGPRA